MVLIRKGDRLWRGEPVSRAEQDLEIRLNRRVDFIKVNPTVAEEMKGRDSPTQQAIAKGMESQLSVAEEMKIVKAKEDGKRLIAEKRAQGAPFHRPPRGITTNKQKHGDSTATEWVPVDEYRDDDGNRIRYKEFDTCIEILNEIATTDKSPYKVGKEFDIPNPDQKM